jgi:general secretion pathway protein M
MARFVTFTRSTWWTARSVRERRLLVLLAVLLTLALLWVAVIRPLMDARAAADARLNAAVTELARARAEAAAVTQQAAAAPAGDQVPLPIDAFLRQSGAEQGFTNIVVACDRPERATISIAQVRPPAFFGWIAQLEARGLVVEALSARTNADQTIAVEAVLRAGGR